VKLQICFSVSFINVLMVQILQNLLKLFLRLHYFLDSDRVISLFWAPFIPLSGVLSLTGVARKEKTMQLRYFCKFTCVYDQSIKYENRGMRQSDPAVLPETVL
jgi:hypothetical protein